MSLGETIYRLRTEKSLSQGDLAEMLNVSRQSISKWENNSAVPDLERIVKLSEVFGVSLDELVKGEVKARKEVSEPQKLEAEPVKGETTKVEIGFLPRKVAGTILLCMAFLVILVCMLMGDLLSGLVLSLPFFACGIICFAFKKNAGLWCVWAVYLLFDIYMSYATGISRAHVLYTYTWTPHMNYLRLIFAWVLVISLAILIAITVKRFWKIPFSTEKKARMQLIVACGVVVVLQVAAMLLPRTQFYGYLLAHIFSMEVVYRFLTLLLSWSRIIAVTVALVTVVRFVRRRKINS